MTNGRGDDAVRWQGKNAAVIVLVRNFGQLGNRLLLSAHLIAAAREYGVPFLNPSFAEYAQYFSSTANDLWCRYPSVTAHSFHQTLTRPLSRRLAYRAAYLTGKALWQCQRFGMPVPMIRLRGNETCDLSSDSFRRRAQATTPLLLSGWGFRSEPLLAKHAAAVRAHFEILPRHRDRVSSLMDCIGRGSKPIIGVHVRHGDYATFENGRFFFSVAQYVSAMQRIRQQLVVPDPTFFVCSNVPLDRKDFGDLQVHFGTGHLVEDMYSLAETDFLIGPPSTFTGWASFYGNVPLQFMETADTAFDLSALRDRLSSRAA